MGPQFGCRTHTHIQTHYILNDIGGCSSGMKQRHRFIFSLTLSGCLCVRVLFSKQKKKNFFSRWTVVVMSLYHYMFTTHYAYPNIALRSGRNGRLWCTISSHARFLYDWRNNTKIMFCAWFCWLDRCMVCKRSSRQTYATSERKLSSRVSTEYKKKYFFAWMNFILYKIYKRQIRYQLVVVYICWGSTK